MAEVFEVTGDDIKALRDDNLRDLIGLLCEADYRLAEMSTAGITWGGNQDANDGGLDVVVQNNFNPPATSHIPRRFTGFQVKKSAMAPAEIAREMKPLGTLRDSITQLIAQNGAYIIVSSGASTSHSATQKRIDGMRNAVSDVHGHANLLIDFFDNGRVATWVRSHPSLILWVKDKIGKPVQGWQPYANWSNSPQNLNEYLTDEGLRICYGKTNEEDAKTGIQRLRNTLSQSRAFVRLVGLSGVGKTRLVQALFDSNVEGTPLNFSLAYYTDITDSPSPDPVTFAKRLMATRTRAILIIDNCSQDLHKRLVDVCNKADSTISLLTVEYDVREDLPEETDVFRLEPASVNLIRKLIERRYPNIGRVAADSIAKFSDGNARVAIALADNIRHGENLGRLGNDQLFKRLFQQKNEHDKDLLRHAEVLSLLYSFDGEETAGRLSELQVLAKIGGISPDELYRSVFELQNRKLVQARGNWRAILPHPIANRLAEYSLSSIPKEKIVTAFMQYDGDRLIRSFSRRLWFLHDCEKAKEIVKDWLQPEGWLGKTNGHLNPLGFDVLKNVATVAPEETLKIIEHWASGIQGIDFLSQGNSAHNDFVHLLHQIAYEPELFIRCINLIVQFECTIQEKARHMPTKQALTSLFHIVLSGTQATAKTRAQAIEMLWITGDERRKEIVLELLTAAFQIDHFTSYYDHQLGTRVRNWGLEPQTLEDVVLWYKTFLSLAVKFVMSKDQNSLDVKQLLARNFRSLWRIEYFQDDLYEAYKQISEHGIWDDGWVSVRQTIHYDLDKNTPELQEKLYQLERYLRPANLHEKIEVYVLSKQHTIEDLDDIEEDEHTHSGMKGEKTAFKLGVEVATEPIVFAEFLPRFLLTWNWRIESFGMGLAKGANDKMKLWRDIRTAYDELPKDKIEFACLIGVLSSPSMDPLREEIMESLVEDTILAKFFPHIQFTLPITKDALSRLSRSLDIGIAPVSAYERIIGRNAHAVISDTDFVPLLKKIYDKPDSILAVYSILDSRLHSLVNEHSDALLEMARQVLLHMPYHIKQNGNTYSDYELAFIADKCLKPANAALDAEQLCNILSDEIAGNNINVTDFPLLLGKLAELYPFMFLDKFLPSEITNNKYASGIDNDLIVHENLLGKIPNDELIEWCELQPLIRYPMMASAVRIFEPTPENKSIKLTSITYKLLENSLELADILKIFEERIIPPIYSGAQAIITNAQALRELYTHENKSIVSWAQETYTAVVKRTEREQQAEEAHERAREKARNERFE